MKIKILVCILAYNEELNIASVIKDLRDYNVGYDILIIDDGSSDNTLKICNDAKAPVLSHCINSGSFNAVKTYFLYAHKYDYDILCQFDGDSQHMASELPRILAPIKAGEADYVIGSRFLEKNGFQSYPIRRFGIKLFAAINSWIIGQRITDSTSGFRAYNRKVIDLFGKRFKSEIYDTIQLTLLTYFHGARIKEVPVKMREREYGFSEYNTLNSIKFVIQGLVNFVGCLLQRNQVK